MSAASSSSSGSAQRRRRYTITTAVQQKNEYPEHLNPFREENEDAKTNNKYGTFGRRNSRLTASLRLKSWFPSKSSKPGESDVVDSQASATPKDKYATLTPKISRQIKDMFTLRKRSRETLAPIPTRTSASPEQFVGDEFKLAPRSSRERFATPPPPPAATPPAARERASSLATHGGGVQPPVPLPRTILPKAESKTNADQTMEVSASVDASGATGLTLHIAEDDRKYVRQGARPKKKRQAPLPPTATALVPASSSSKLVSSTELSETASLSASINSDCPSPAPSLTSEAYMDVVVVPSPSPSPLPSPSSPPSPSSSSPRTSQTEDSKGDRLV